jgi:hypothetical protein
MQTPSISDVMEAYAKDAEADARKRGFILDYSETSLENVDRILNSITSGNVINPQTESEKDDLWILAKIYGGYLGQVVIREMTGQWELQDLPNGSARVVLRSCGIQAFPPEKIFKRLTQDRFSGVGGYCRALRAILERREKENKG